MTSPEALCAQAPEDLRKRDEFILSQLTEVHFIARRIHKRLPVFVPLEDLVHSGVLGLLEATEKYDSTKQVRFKTFAQFRIRGAILDSLRKLDRVSRRMRSKSRRLVAACEQLSQKLGRQPTEEEIAQEVGLEPAALRKLASTLRSMELTDRQVAIGQDRAETRDLIESAPASPEESPLARILRSEMRQLLVQAMTNLSEREQQVLSLYYVEQLTMQEIASILAVKSSRISQIHSSAIAKLRGYLEAKKVSEDSRNRDCVSSDLARA
ncbi:MAG: FliA/WhiG family RNA polymerase sigma factor [Acidobacteriia bacterium]|nr:FliA/WhiG family RNA polymerase sigma factor [Terriglobia bacterium]